MKLMEQEKPQTQTTQLGKPLNTVEGIKEVLMWTQGVISGQIKSEEVKEFAFNEIKRKRNIINEAK